MTLRMLFRFALVLATLLLALGAAGCGGGDDEGEEEGEERAAVACEGTALSSTRLPESFPEVQGVTLTKQETTGPTEVVDGYYEGELEDAYESFKQALEDAGYDILFDEIEEDDSEVSYAGEGRSGQVALRKDCEEDGRIAVHITSRPE
jgi:hypothetical protein